MDLLVLPSRAEGQGLAVLEAFRVGVPVVASNSPALAELVEDGRTRFLFESGNAASLAAAIRTALRLPPRDRDALIRNAGNRFPDDFTVDRMIARHEELYARLASYSPGIVRFS